jgi:DNA polymerase-3 subunit gamma/tau
MSYLVLARKSRPQKFDQVIGQRPVVQTLRNSIARDRVAHAILFSGVRGVGKTTLARIMAKAINCQAEASLRPCNECSPCREIASGNFLDLYEIDGASNRGIQEIRELKEKIRFLPTSAQFRIIIIDEVHMLTTEAFNALLKTLEEPPAHVYFMFATTEIHKIPITILSRCQQYELKKIPAKELSDHFDRLARDEGFTIAPEALSIIVREAGGSVRDGLSLLDQMFSYGEKEIATKDVVEVLGLVSRDLLMRLTRALLQGDKAAAFHCLQDVFDFGMDLKRFIEDLLDSFRTLLLCRISGCQELVDVTAEELEDSRNLAAEYSLETLHLKLTLLMAVAEDLKFAAQPRLTLETSFLQIIEAGNVIPLSSLLGKIDQLLPELPHTAELLEQSVKADNPEPESAKKPAELQQAVVEKPSALMQPQTSSPVQATPVTRQKSVETIDPETPKERLTAPDTDDTTPAQAVPQQQGLEEQAAVTIKSHEKNIRSDWLEFIDYVKERKTWMAQDLQRVDSVRDEVEGEMQLHYLDGANCALLRQRENLRLLTEFALDFFQKPLNVKFIVPDYDDSPDANGDDSPHKKRQQLANDPLVVMAAEIFNGQVGDIRVGPRSR